jgi:hypothetical protein
VPCAVANGREPVSKERSERTWLDRTESWFEVKKRKDQFLMRMNLRYCVRVVAVAIGMSISGGVALQAAGAAFFQDHDQDYSKNKRYQQGIREGKSDGAHNRDHSKKRHFAKDEDQKAYEAGYQKGHGN